MRWPAVVATQSMLLSGRHTTSTLSPMAATLSADRRWEMMGTQGLAYQMRMESRVMAASRMRSLLAEILMGAVGLSWGMASSRGQPTG